MSKNLNSVTLNKIINGNSLTTTQLLGSVKTDQLYQCLKIVEALQSDRQLFISKDDYNEYQRYSEYLKTYIKTNSIPQQRYYTYRMKINKLYTLSDNRSKLLLHGIILSLYYNFTHEQILEYFSNADRTNRIPRT